MNIEDCQFEVANLEVPVLKFYNRIPHKVHRRDVSLAIIKQENVENHDLRLTNHKYPLNRANRKHQYTASFNEIIPDTLLS